MVRQAAKFGQCDKWSATGLRKPGFRIRLSRLKPESGTSRKFRGETVLLLASYRYGLLFGFASARTHPAGATQVTGVARRLAARLVIRIRLRNLVRGCAFRLHGRTGAWDSLWRFLTGLLLPSPFVHAPRDEPQHQRCFRKDAKALNPV